MFSLSASNHIPANANTATTAQLTAPANKSTNNFGAGWISDDTNPLPAVNTTANQYTELEWAIAANANVTTNHVYTFRVTANGANLNTYSANATWTISASPANASVNQTLATLTIDANGTIAVAAVVAQTLGSASIASTGAVAIKASLIGGQGQLDILGQAITGTVVVSAGVQQGLADASLSAAATVSISGTVAQTLAAVEISASAGASGGEVNAAVAQTLATMVPQITGSVAVTGTVTQPLASIGLSAAAVVPVVATVSQALSGATLASTATTRVSGTVAQTLAALARTITSTVAVNGTLAQTLAPLTISANASGITSAFVLSPSTYIAANAATNTTGQLTAPSGKTVNGYFQAGKISDDTNPLPSIDLIVDTYTELEWSLKSTSLAVNTANYHFRVTANGANLTNYAVTPTWQLLNAINGTVNQTLASATLAFTALRTTPGEAVVEQTLQNVGQEITGTTGRGADVTQTLGSVSDTRLYAVFTDEGGGTPDHWNFYFGRVSGIYTTIVDVPYTSATIEVVLRTIAPDTGEWYVAVAAANDGGETTKSNEVFVVVPTFTATVTTTTGIATVTQTLGSVALAALAKVAVRGTVTQTLATMTPTITAAVSVSGRVQQTLAAVSRTITATTGVVAEVAQTLGTLQVNATATAQFSENEAAVNQTLADATVAMTASVYESGSTTAWVDALLDGAQANVTGAVAVAGDVDQELAGIGADIGGWTSARRQSRGNILLDGGTSWPS